MYHDYCVHASMQLPISYFYNSFKTMPSSLKVKILFVRVFICFYNFGKRYYEEPYSTLPMAFTRAGTNAAYPEFL